MENPIFDELSFQHVDFLFDKSMLPIKILRIVLRSFLMLNDQNRNDSVFFKFGRRRAKRGPSEARSERIVVQDGIANPGGTQLGMLGGAPAPPRPPLLLPPSAIRTDSYGRSYGRLAGL